MRPVSEEFAVTQGFGEGATATVAPDPEGRTALGYLVWLYGDYQHDGHAGTDVGCPVGTPVRAARSGTVVWRGWDVDLPGGPNDWAARWFFYQRFGGRLLVIQHAPGDLDVYAHLSAWRVRAGQFVEEGDLVALSGDSSAGEDGQLGPHLHTERIVDLSYTTGAGKIYGRIDPRTVWGGVAAQGSITTEEGDDLSQAEVDQLWTLMDTRATQVQDALERVIKEQVAKVPLATWAYSNEELGGGDAFQHLRNAVAATGGLAEQVAKVAASAASGGATVEQITEAVKAALADGVHVDVNVSTDGGSK